MIDLTENAVQPISRTTTQFSGKSSAGDLATFMAALSDANIVTLPSGKTFADAKTLSLVILPAPLLDGSVATVHVSF